MNGIRLLLLIAASAQVDAGSERDYGWAVNDKDGVLEYIIQINPDKKLAMEQKSVQYPNGQENVSNMPRELVGRATRVVVRFGSGILPREPSLQELEQRPRLFEQPNASATAILGPGRLQDLETPFRNIQGQGSAPLLPPVPRDFSGAQGQVGSLLDQVGQTANTLRNDANERLSEAMPDPSTLAQNMTNQSGAGGGFLNEPRGGASGGGSRFSNTAQPASPLSTPTGPLANTPAKMPDYPTGASSPFSSANQAAANNRNPSLGNGSAISNALNYPDRLNQQSLNTQSALTKQQTPSPGFGSTPGLAARTEWPPTGPSSVPSMSQQYDNAGYGGAPTYPQSYTPAPNNGTFPLHVATNTSPSSIPNNSTTIPRQPPPSTVGVVSQSSNLLEQALLKFDKNKDGQLSYDEYPTPTDSSIDGILQVLFLLSLVVNFYLGILIRKLLIRYRLLLTNVRTQTAYT